MSCPKCAAPTPDGSAFCSKCGAALAGAAPPPVASAGAPLSEPEQELWSGRFSGKAHAHRWILWAIYVIGLGVLYVKFPPQAQANYSRWIQYGYVAAAVVPLLAILFSTLTSKASVRYRLTTHRLFKETGVLSRDMNEIELVRVDDVSVHQNLIQRMFNVGTITVIAPHDQTEPRLEMVGIEKPIEVKEQIRTYVRRRRTGSLNVENL